MPQAFWQVWLQSNSLPHWRIFDLMPSAKPTLFIYFIRHYFICSRRQRHYYSICRAIENREHFRAFALEIAAGTAPAPGQMLLYLVYSLRAFPLAVTTAWSAMRCILVMLPILSLWWAVSDVMIFASILPRENDACGDSHMTFRIISPSRFHRTRRHLPWVTRQEYYIIYISIYTMRIQA